MKTKKTPIIYPILPRGLGSNQPIVADPLGSYTGVPQDAAEKPVQDADDL